MAGTLYSGPAGAGKTQAAQEELDRNPRAVVVDFQSLYAALLLLERQPDGRYPEREARREYIIPLVEYVRRAIIRAANRREIDPIATNSDGDAMRRQELLTRLGPGSREIIVDPGLSVVTERLSVDGELSQQCGSAISRWYARL